MHIVKASQNSQFDTSSFIDRLDPFGPSESLVCRACLRIKNVFQTTVPARVYKFCKCPPAPRLVGIEPNPGPDTESSFKKSLNKKLVAVVVPKNSGVLVKTKKNKKSKKSKLNSSAVRFLPGSSSRTRMGAPATANYYKTLADPFEHSGIRIGFGTLCDTSLATMSKRLIHSGASGNSLAIVMNPIQNHVSTAGVNQFYPYGFLSWSTTGLTNSWATWNPDQATPFLSMSNQHRVVSGGLRVRVIGPATSAPPIVYVTPLPGVSTTELTNIGLVSLPSLPQTSMFVGTNALDSGISCCYRPHDLSDMDFIISGDATPSMNARNDHDNSMVITIIGMSTSHQLIVEAIAHYEFINSIFSSPVNTDGRGSDSLASEHANIESMISKVKENLPSAAAVIDGVRTSTQVINSLGNAFKTGAALGKAVNNIVHLSKRHSQRIHAAERASDGSYTDTYYPSSSAGILGTATREPPPHIPPSINRYESFDPADIPEASAKPVISDIEMTKLRRLDQSTLSRVMASLGLNDNKTDL